jgi:DUF4097 and DUF4098 domain-containing protein YvlB
MVRLSTIAVVAGCLSSACSIDVNGAGVTTVEQKTFTVTAAPELTLRTSDGSIDIRSWDRNEIQVEIQRRAATAEDAKALEVTTSQDGNRIVVEAPERDHNVIRIGNWVGESVSFVVRVPRQLTLDATTGDGSISVDDLEGALGLRSGDGSIRGTRVQGALTARTGDGSISVSDAAGRVNLDTGDGSVRLSARLEALRVHTGDGSVALDVLDGSQMASDWSLETGDGSITATLPAQFSAEVDVATGDGSIRVNSATADRGNHEDRGRLHTRLGAGGRTLSARTGDGSITITTR